MKTFLAFLLAISCFVSLVSGEPFTASSLNSPFAIAGDISGDLSVLPSSVGIKVSTGKIIRQPQGISPERRILGVRAFLATWTDDKKTFRKIATSDLLALDRVIAVGESISIDGATFDIPTDQLSAEQVKTTWLAFQIDDELVSETSTGGPGHCYVHTESFLGGTSHGFSP